MEIIVFSGFYQHWWVSAKSEFVDDMFHKYLWWARNFRAPDLGNMVKGEHAGDFLLLRLSTLAGGIIMGS